LLLLAVAAAVLEKQVVVALVGLEQEQLQAHLEHIQSRLVRVALAVLEVAVMME